MGNSDRSRASIMFRNVPPKLTKLYGKRTEGGGIPSRGTPNRRVIAKNDDGNYLHATKGYRK